MNADQLCLFWKYKLDIYYRYLIQYKSMGKKSRSIFFLFWRPVILPYHAEALPEKKMYLQKSSGVVCYNAEISNFYFYRCVAVVSETKLVLTDHQ